MDVLTRAEAARYLRLSLRKLDSLAARGEIRRIKLGDGRRARVLFRRNDLDAFLNEHLSADRSEIRRKAMEISRSRRAR